MTKAQQVKFFAQYSDEQLAREFAAIGTRDSNRVKATGRIKIKAANFGDRILDEQKRRRAIIEA